MSVGAPLPAGPAPSPPRREKHTPATALLAFSRFVRAELRRRIAALWARRRVRAALFAAGFLLLALLGTGWDFAAATPRGLVVPNIKDAGRLSLRELADAMTALVATAREGRTSPADLSGGTFTITNVGVFGVDSGTPILPPGEAAILAFGAVRPTPWVHTGKVKVRDVTTLGLSFDHRIIDGELGSLFLRDVGGFLADPEGSLLAWA